MISEKAGTEVPGETDSAVEGEKMDREDYSGCGSHHRQTSFATLEHIMSHEVFLEDAKYKRES